MSYKIAVLLIALASVRASFGQALLCPAGSETGKPCETFHFHMQIYSPEARDFTEVYGTNQFASQRACEQARELRLGQNAAVVTYMREVRGNQQYQADRIGPCHCDKTVEKSSPNFLTDDQRAAQVRMAEEIRMRVRERLLDSGLKSDAELVARLKVARNPNSLLGGPRLTSLPPPAPVNSGSAPNDLRLTRPSQAASPAASSFDLPLAEISVTGLPPLKATPPGKPSPGTAAASTPAAVVTASPQPPSSPAPSGEQVAAAPSGSTPPEPRVAEASVEAAPAEEDAADVFISYETQRIQSVLKASNDITDDATKAKILEACMRRIQVLSNLRLLIQGSGTRSRIAVAARNAREESDRLALESKLFGSDIVSHWAPRDIADVVLDTRPDVEADPERVLRDTSGASSDPQKKRALYLVLGRAPVTEEQQLWLIPIIDKFLE